MVNLHIEKQCEISTDDLPLCCPLPKESLWNAHPRVYLPIEEAGRVRCPYCSTEYVLVSSSIYSDLSG